ncbi:LysR family transcriptional regulator [Plantibacter sp. Mn2098]|uniref:LysR family transcriptional regulator n=1 Tax=Plantibacter sp. Mn2098 TaxID=3395266 RepID=UPI003BDFC459
MDRPDEMTLRLLLEVGARGSLTSASNSLGISQQAASARVRLLEGQIGAPLLERSARGSTLTPAGLLVAGWAQEFVAASERLRSSIETLRAGVDAEITVASSLTIAEHLLPEWLVRLREQRDARQEMTSVSMIAGNSDTVVDLVRARSASVGFIESPDVPDDLESRQIARDELVLVVHPGHAWARPGRMVTAAEVALVPLITREVGSGTRLALERALRGMAETLTLNSASIELPSNAAIRATVAAGSGPAILSVLAVADDLVLGRVVQVPITDLAIIRPLSAIWMPGTLLTAVAQELLTIAARR